MRTFSRSPPVCMQSGGYPVHEEFPIIRNVNVSGSFSHHWFDWPWDRVTQRVCLRLLQPSCILASRAILSGKLIPPIPWHITGPCSPLSLTAWKKWLSLESWKHWGLILVWIGWEMWTPHVGWSMIMVGQVIFCTRNSPCWRLMWRVWRVRQKRPDDLTCIG